MNVIDSIIQKRDHILTLATKHGVIALKLYGSVLARSESEESDIDFLGLFDPTILYDWKARLVVADELEQYFNRRVSVVDSRDIPEVFRPSIDTDPVDIMELSTYQQYSITPKSSKLYYLMLNRTLTEYDLNQWGYVESLYISLAENVSYWLSRLLRLNDNDLKEYQGFYYVEVLYFCDKFSPISNYDYIPMDMIRLKMLLQQIYEYVELRLEK
ncbi:Predicted nucleotidyltransferase [Paenibacillus sp. 1_12]|uniref:nucleotidyltransferase family protein n=1 Tax=Paenibacillus sp. 1_12 TaxID=1566278 RepID=UPI0008E3A0CD|nr:hypothetical protein [Paenibacillus sp. 1_12]SFM51189.1 Predicted nucleotidyltransferase [Paenibacillus sp. 1_12]